jgi:hypothetical protein
MGFSISGDYAPMSMKTVGVASEAAVPHCTPVPVDVKTCPEVPAELAAVRVPVRTALERVAPERVGLVPKTRAPVPVTVVAPV